MGRVKEAFLCPPDDRDSPWEPTDDELEAMASEYFASISPKPIPCDPTEEDPWRTRGPVGSHEMQPV